MKKVLIFSVALIAIAVIGYGAYRLANEPFTVIYRHCIA